ncbi:MAG: ABC transporter permease [Deltaproteobacteria bacterium]|jgi:ABC-2 type transport system permease protein|nr:ABC transporter permease [Deltaproteobacteria bacterium]
MKTIMMKELADHFSSVRFMILLAAVFMVALLGIYMAGQGVRDLLSQGGGEYLAGRSFLALFTAPGAFMSLFAFMALFGPMVGLVLGFDAINRERNQGTLSKILAQPIYRDEVILGKYLAGLITVAILFTALMVLLVGLGLMGLGLVPTVDEVLRLVAFLVLSIIYVGFWLGLALLLSIVFRSVATSALAAAALWILMSFFVPVLGQAVAQSLVALEDPRSPQAEELAAYDRVSKLIALASPPALFSQASTILLDPTNRGGSQALRLSTMSRLDQYLLNRFQGVLSINQSLILMAGDLLALMAFYVGTFLLSYLAFVRQEVRSA